MNKDIILSIDHLQTRFRVDKSTVYAVNDVSLALERGQTLGIVGESGCGKSVTAHSVLQLLPPNGYISGGRVEYFPTAGAEPLVLSGLSKKSPELRKIRGKDIAMIFQDPMSSLNPVYTVGKQIEEVLKIHEKGLSGEERRSRSIAMLEELGIPIPDKRVDEYPHQFSGGMKQRVMIAIAMVCNPNILIADEPTTALDVTIQAQILRLMKELQHKHGTSVIFITHNMGIVSEVCDSVAVMYMGRVVEYGSKRQIFKNPLHPYTRALMKAVPVLGRDRANKLDSIPGNTPDASIQFDRCEFEPRCSMKCDRCREGFPALTEAEPGHTVRCKLYEGGGENV